MAAGGRRHGGIWSPGVTPFGVTPSSVTVRNKVDDVTFLKFTVSLLRLLLAAPLSDTRLRLRSPHGTTSEI